jgi:hypothetical protein
VATSHFPQNEVVTDAIIEMHVFDVLIHHFPMKWQCPIVITLVEIPSVLLGSSPPQVEFLAPGWCKRFGIKSLYSLTKVFYDNSG